MLRNSIYKTRRTSKGHFKSMKSKVFSNTTKKCKIKFHEEKYFDYSIIIMEKLS